MAQIKAKQIQVVATGDLIIGASSVSGFSGSILSIGATNQILTSNGTTGAWGYLGTLRDTTGDAIVTVADITGPVNTLEIAAGTSGTGPTFTATGTDTNIDINLTTKGTGEILVPVSYQAVSANALITKSEVDAIATGLDFKNSVRASTCAASELSGFTYSTVADDNSTATPLVWTGAGSAVFDGITLSDGDRVIIKDSPDARGNGIFTFDAGSGFRRAADADNSPDNEVSGGMFAFVEEGDIKADTGWVVSSPDGVATLGTDEIVWTQFSAAGVVTPGTGLEQVGTTLNVTVDDVTVYIDGGNDVAVKSSATANEVLLSDGTSTTPAWGALPLGDSNSVTGTLDETNGGTGETTYDNGDLLVGESTGGGLTILPVVDAAGTQVLSYNDATDTVEWTAASNIGGNSFGLVTGDTGTATADSTSDTIAITGGIGISTAAADSPDSLVITFDNSGMADTATVLADTFPFFDGSNSDEAEFRSFEDMFDDLNVPHDILGTGIVIKTGDTPDTYETKEIDASTVDGEEGITVTNADGTASGDIVIGFDIIGQTLIATVDAPNDFLIMYDATTGENVRVTAADIAASGGAVTTAWNTMIGDTGTAIADSASDTITMTGGIGISTTAADSPDAITFEFNNSGMADTPVVLADTFPFFDGSNSDEAEFRSFSDLITDIGLLTNAFTTIVGDSGTSPVADGSDTLTLTGGEGIATTGDLSSDTITIDIDITGLVLETAIDTSADEIAFYDSSAGAHRKATFDDVASALGVGSVAEDVTTAVSTSSVFAGFFTSTPISDEHVTVFFNGLALDNADWVRSGTTLTLIPASIGYGVETGDDIKARYEF